MMEKEIKDRQMITYYECGHTLHNGVLSLGYDDQQGILDMIRDGNIPQPKEKLCPACKEANNRKDIDDKRPAAIKHLLSQE
jgi:hypothetical protein